MHDGIEWLLGLCPIVCPVALRICLRKIFVEDLVVFCTVSLQYLQRAIPWIVGSCFPGLNEVCRFAKGTKDKMFKTLADHLGLVHLDCPTRF